MDDESRRIVTLFLGEMMGAGIVSALAGEIAEAKGHYTSRLVVHAPRPACKLGPTVKIQHLVFCDISPLIETCMLTYRPDICYNYKI